MPQMMSTIQSTMRLVFPLSPSGMFAKDILKSFHLNRPLGYQMSTWKRILKLSKLGYRFVSPQSWLGHLSYDVCADDAQNKRLDCPQLQCIVIAWHNRFVFLKPFISQAPVGAEEVEILRVVGQSFTVNYKQWDSDISTNLVRETLSEDLIERFIVDILEITEQLSSKPLLKRLNRLSHY